MIDVIPSSEVIFYSHPRVGDGYLYSAYSPNPDRFNSIGGKEAETRVRQADVWAQPIGRNLDTGYRFQVNPDKWSVDNCPEPQEIIDRSGSKYADLAVAVERALGRTGLIILISGPVPFEASWR